jgi:hypothetical protein
MAAAAVDGVHVKQEAADKQKRKNHNSHEWRRKKRQQGRAGAKKPVSDGSPSVTYVEPEWAFMWERPQAQDQPVQAKKEAQIRSNFRTPSAPPHRFTWRPDPVRLTDQMFPAPL